jgi:hypothetical protein
VDLTKFLQARLDEDDAEALKLHDRLDGNVPLQRAFAARMLREVEAKRKLIAAIERAEAASDAVDTIQLGYGLHDELLGYMAAIYENHPDYDPAWKET